MFDSIRPLFQALAPAVDFCSLRLVCEASEAVTVRQDVLQPLQSCVDTGAMVTVIHRGGYGYAATSDLSKAGLQDAIDRAVAWAAASAGRSVVDYTQVAHARPSGNYAGPAASNAPLLPRKDVIALLMAESRSCKIDDRIVDWYASIGTVDTTQLYLSADGADVQQQMR